MSTDSCTPAPDAFAPGKDMLRTAEALERLLAAVSPVEGTEDVALMDALGRVLAADVVSTRAVPPHDNTAVDGYAVFHADLPAEGTVTLPVTGQDAGPGAIYDSNRFVLMGLLRGLGAEVIDLGIVPDEAATVRAVLAEAGTRADVIITSGGVSTGDTDHVKGAVEDLGALNFWRIAIRPGRPLAFGHVGAVPFIGLPGNPVASMLTFLIFARPLLLRLMGAEDKAPLAVPAVADFAFKKRVGRREWVRASVRRGDDGRLVLSRFPKEGSGILTSMVVSGGLAELPEDLPGVEPGTVLDFLPFSELLT